MHPTTAQNAAHRNDIAWIKTTGRDFRAAGERYISEYTNPFTGQAIRKSWRMTGMDWHLFDTDGALSSRHRSLTIAKLEASNQCRP